MQRAGSHGRKTEPRGTMVIANTDKYLIDDLLGQGGMGDVYKVHMVRDPTRVYAMKTERRDVDSRLARLKVETNVFDAIQASKPGIDKSHFVYMHDKGKTSTFKYYIMDMIGPSLADIRRNVLQTQFPLNNVIAIARQTIKAVESLHEVGWLHRDMKPANFAVGLPPREHIVYMIDFGTARKYRDGDGGIRVPRCKIVVPYSPYYCSLRCHEMKEQGRRDDLETWFYMIIDLINEQNLPWWGANKMDKVVEGKKLVMYRPREAIAKGLLTVPEPFIKIIKMITDLSYTDDPDYRLIEEMLQLTVAQLKLDMNEPMAWIGKPMPPPPPKPKVVEVKKEPKKRQQSVEQDGAETVALYEKESKLALELQKMYAGMGEKKTIEEVKEVVRRRMKNGRRNERSDEDEYSDVDYSDEERKDRKRKKVRSKLRQSNTRKSPDRRGKGRKNRDPKEDETRDEERDEKKKAPKKEEKEPEKAPNVKEKTRDAEKKDAVEEKKAPDAKKK